LSKDSTFTPGTSISGFTTVIPGFNLSSAISGAFFTGTVSTAATLSGITASQFLRSDQAASSAYAVTVGSLLVGSDLTVATSSGDVSVRNGTSNKSLDFFVKPNNVDQKAIGITGTTGAVSITYGPFSVANATTLSGAVSCSSTLAVTGITTVTGKILPSVTGTIDIGASGTKFGNVHANYLVGTSVTAQYADLAERFEADNVYSPGTVVELGGAKEITRAVQELSESVFGVISTAAAYLMNSNAGSNTTHPAVAVSGRVPVRVIGTVKKGDRLVSAGNGLARSADRTEITAFNVIGRALADKTTQDEGTVEAIVKLNS